MGAQVSAAQLETILGYVERGKRRGRPLLAGGERDTRGREGAGQLRPADRLRGRAAGDAHRAGGDLRPGARVPALRGRGEALAIANGTPLRARRRRSGRATWRAHALARRVKLGRGLDQLLQRVRRRGAVRRLQGVRLGRGPVASRRSRVTSRRRPSGRSSRGENDGAAGAREKARRPARVPRSIGRARGRARARRGRAGSRAGRALEQLARGEGRPKAKIGAVDVDGVSGAASTSRWRSSLRGEGRPRLLRRRVRLGPRGRAATTTRR